MPDPILPVEESPFFPGNPGAGPHREHLTTLNLTLTRLFREYGYTINQIIRTQAGTTFLGLTDTPGSYVGEDGKHVTVSSGALVFTDLYAQTTPWSAQQTFNAGWKIPDDIDAVWGTDNDVLARWDNTAGAWEVQCATGGVLDFNSSGTDTDVQIQSDANADHFYSDAGLFGGVGAFGFGAKPIGLGFIEINPDDFTYGTATPYATVLLSTPQVTFTTGTIATASALHVVAPDFVEAGGTITEANTLYVTGAPTEGDTNWAVRVGGGASLFSGNVQIDSDSLFVSAQRSVIGGHQLLGSNTLTVCIGDATTEATSNRAIGVGSGALARGADSTCVGPIAEALDSYDTAVGVSARSSGGYATAVGQGATASALATALGATSTASSLFAVQIGPGTASGLGAIGIGNSAVASNTLDVAAGYLANASGGNSFAMGLSAIASGIWSTAIGATSEATAASATAVGVGSTSNHSNAFSTQGGTADGENSASMGVSSTTGATHINSFAIGTLAASTKANQIIFGTTSYVLTTQVSAFELARDTLELQFGANLNTYLRRGSADGILRIAAKSLTHNHALDINLDSGATVITIGSTSGATLIDWGTLDHHLADIEIDGDINHDGSNIGFFAVAPVARALATADLKDALTNYGLLQGTSASPLNLDGGKLTCGEAEIDGDLNHDGSNVGFFGTGPVGQASAMTVALTSITHTGPTAADYAIATPIDSGVGSAWGFSTQDEFETVMSVILNLQTRVNELEAMLDSSTGVGIAA